MVASRRSAVPALVARFDDPRARGRKVYTVTVRLTVPMPSLRVFNRKPDALSHEEGAALIKELSNLKRRVA